MLRKFCSLFLSGLMIFALTIRPAQAQVSPEDKLRHRVIEWGPNKAVALQLKSGEKLQGRIAEIKDDALTMQFLQQGKIDTRDFRWNEIKKVSLKQNTEDKVRKTGGFIALGALALIVVVVVVALNDPNF
jgi:preprotein translocase subunit SecF